MSTHPRSCLWTVLFSTFLPLVFSSLFLLLYLRQSSWGEVDALLQHSEWVFLWPAIMALLAGHALRLLRWHFLLRAVNPAIQLRSCITPFLASFALNNVLPLRLGDVARATLFEKRLGVSVSTVVSSLILERLFDLLSLVLVFFTALSWLSINIFQSTLVAYVSLVSLAILLVVSVLLVFRDFLSTLFTRLYNQLQTIALMGRLFRFAARVADDAARHFTHRATVSLLSLSLAVWVCEALLFWGVSRSFGVVPGIAPIAFVMALATFSTLLPSTPGYVGTFHYLCSVAFGLVGVAMANAVAASFLIHAVLVLPVTVCGLILLFFYFGHSWPQLKANIAALRGRRISDLD